MKRLVLAGLLVVFALVVCAGDVLAHGGQYRGPGGAVPPGQRQPNDPVPPPPPPPSGQPPVTPPPATPPSGGPAPATPPQTPPQTPTPTVPTDGPTKARPTNSLGFENWVFWYHNNKADLENLKSKIYERIASESPLFQISGKDLDNLSDATHDTRVLVGSDIIPALLRVIGARKMHQDTQSAAYIALAKMAKDPEHIEVLMKGLDHDRKHDLLVEESAAIALGLLRRTGKRQGQFDAVELDKVRKFLFQVFEDDEYGGRTRGFAALAIGLLGDQPSGSGSYSGHDATTSRLFGLLGRSYRSPDLPIGLLVAIGLQPAPSVTGEQRQVLRDCLTKGRIGKDKVQAIVQSYAALALGRIGTATDIMVLQRAMTSRRNKDRNIQRSCAIGLGQLGRLVSGEARIEVAQALLKSIDRLSDASAMNFAVISLAYLVIADVQAGKTDVFGGTKVGKYLLDLADDGKYIQRPFGALALALIGREIVEDTSIQAYGEFRARSVEVLRRGLGTKKLDKRGRAAFATSLGIIGDEGSVAPLAEIVADKKEDQELRGYAALGLGLIGVAPPRALASIRAALKERRSEELRQQTATALGLLKDRDGVDLLLDELSKARSQNVKGQIVLALARIGDARAVGPLIALLEDEREQDLTRALACAGLGVIGDLEWLPSLSRISLDVNYRASTDLINEVLSLI